VDIAAWLHSLGMQEYEQAFRDNAIDATVLPELTADDLRDLGVSLIGHRRKLLAAIAALRGDIGPIPETAAAVSTAERRQLTVMFCDLVGSTALAARLDPEDLREVIAAYHHAVARVVAGFEGLVAKYMGDGVLVYFGYPRAHEDDAERAVRAGLGLIGAVARLDVKSVRLQTRVGIATGLVVVGDLIGEGSAQEQSVVGETPNLAARLQALAEPDAVVIAAGTRQLIGDFFEYRDLGTVEVKGIAAPVPAWHVLRPSSVASRFEALRSGETPLIGRDEELELLRRRWTQAKAGAGSVVLICAEPGIGKSRLAEAFRESLEGEPHARLRYFCSSHHQNSALFPFIAQLERSAGFERDETPSAKLTKLEALIAANAGAEGDFPLLAELLSLPSSDRYAPLDLTPQRKKEKTFEALLRLLAALVQQLPVVMIFEDLHWADATSRELLDLIIERVATMPVLLIATFRPEFQPPWTGQPHATTLSLRRLGRDESDLLVRGIIGTDSTLPKEVVEEIIERTDGVPLFLEELTKAVLEAAISGPGHGREALSSVPATPVRVPATLHASLMARLDRLGPTAKEIAQVGAAIGREFSYELLAPVARRSGEELQFALGRLADAGLIFCRGAPPEGRYLFKHSLVRDAAYNTLLRRRRQELHARIAAVLEERFPVVVQTQPELVAHHYTEAGCSSQAIDYWQRAGRRAVERSAHVEAISHIYKGLEVLKTLPDAPERTQHELLLHVTLGVSLVAVQGYAAPEVERVYTRSRTLCQEVGGTPQLFQVLRGLIMFYLVGGHMQTAHDVAEQLLSRTERQSEVAPRMLGHYLLGLVLFFRGVLGEAVQHFTQAIAIYDRQQHRHLAHVYGIDIGVSAQSHRACALWLLGYPDQALAESQEALTLAQEMAHPFSLVGAQLWLAWLHQFRLEPQAVYDRATGSAALATQQGFALYVAWAIVTQGWALTRQDQEAAGIAKMREGIEAAAATGAEAWSPYLLALLAAATEAEGQPEAGLRVLSAAQDMVARSGQRFYEAELSRLAGVLELARSPAAQSQAEGAMRYALDVARRQQTKSLELRAATSLARLRRDQGRRAEARELLAPIYGWFTEGFDTPDLQEARALLDEFGGA
jgi:predicted ATPase/class 3 adenylate cyclase